VAGAERQQDVATANLDKQVELVKTAAFKLPFL
jgi:hypothetical protein